MSKKSLLKKIVRWVLSIIGFLMVVLLLSYFFLGKVVKKKLVDQVSDQTNGAYHISIDDLKIDLLSGDAIAKRIHLKPDTLKINKSKEFRDFYEITAPKTSILGLNLWQLIFDNKIEVDELEIIKPKVRWTRNFAKVTNETSQNETLRVKKLPPIKIKTILLSESGLKIFQNKKSTPLVSFDKASLRVDNFLMKADSAEKFKRMIDFQDLTLSVKDYTMKLPDSLNIFHFDSLKASVRHSSLIINGIELQPRYGNYAFSRKKGVESDRIELYNKEVYVKGLDFEKLKQENKIIARLIIVDSINMVVYRDKTHPVKPTERKKLIQEQIREAPVYLLIDSIQLSNAQVTYQEKVEKTTPPGNINFVNLQASISNITNDSILLKAGPSMKTQAQTYIMGVGKIQASFNFPIGNKNNFHSVRGSVSEMPMDIINPMLRYVAFAEIESGKVNSANFTAELNEDVSSGSLDFFYEDLKINFLNKGEENEKKGFVSFLANSFVIKSDNPLNGKFREGNIGFERAKNKSMINFWWKTLFSGIKDSIGVPSNNDQTAEKN